MRQQHSLRSVFLVLCGSATALCLSQPAQAQFVDDFSGGRDSRWSFLIRNNANSAFVNTERSGAYAPVQGADSINLPLQTGAGNGTFAGSEFQANAINLPVSASGISDWYIEARVRFNQSATSDQYNRLNLSLFSEPRNSFSVSAKNAGFSNNGSLFFNTQVHTSGSTEPANLGADNDNSFFQTSASYASFYDIRIARNSVATTYTSLFGGTYTAPAGSFTTSVNTAGTGIGNATNFAFGTVGANSMFGTGGVEDVYNTVRDYANDAGDRGELGYQKLSTFSAGATPWYAAITALNYTNTADTADLSRFETNLVVIPEASAASLMLLALPAIAGLRVATRRRK